MSPILRIYPNGDWCVFRPHATGCDTGPAAYGAKPHDRTANAVLPFYRSAGFVIDDQRQQVAA